MPAYNVGVTNPFDSLGVMPTPVMGVAINFFADRAPLLSRLPKRSLRVSQFELTSDTFRPRSVLAQEALDDTETGVDVPDGSVFLPGDVIEVDSEQMLVASISSNTLTVTRAYAGTTAAAHSNGATVYLIGNTRTGAEVDQNGISRIPTTVKQYMQTVQHPYGVGGALNSRENYALPPGAASVLGRDRAYAMQHAVDDLETSMYYGTGVGLAASTTRPAMKGLRALVTTNKTTSPTNAGAYKPSDLIRDTLEKCYTYGGNPNFLLVSSDFMTGLSTWGQAVQYVGPGETEFGVPIQTLKAPFLGDVEIVVAPLLRSGTAVCLSRAEVMIKVARDMFDKPKGSRGDADEGDIIVEAAIAVENEAHHAWVSGITAFSAT